MNEVNELFTKENVEKIYVPDIVKDDLLSIIEEKLKKAGFYYRVAYRVKAPDSMLDKLILKDYRRPGTENQDKKMQDLIGIRIILYYADDVEIVKNFLDTIFSMPGVWNTTEANEYEFRAMKINGIFKLPGYLSNSLYVLEANIRHAAILGYVGAGGIGLLLNEKISWREYSRVGMILVMLFVAVLVVEGISTFLKAYLDGRIKRNTTANVIISVCIMVFFVYSLSAVKDVSTSKLGIKVVGAIMHGITHPDWEYMFMTGKSGVMYLMLETIAIAVAGTCAGAVFAVILTLINSRKFIPAPMAFIGRLVVMAIRTVPVYVYGLIFIRVTGPGSFAGVLTMMMCSIGLLTKRFTVAVDNWNMAAWNACKCAGTGFIARLRHVAGPELKFQFKDAVMYRLDVNVRSASILGLVGAGGIGAPLIVYMNNYRWDAVGSILIVLFVVVLLIELLSKCLKRIH